MSIIIDNCVNCQAIAFFLPFNALTGSGLWKVGSGLEISLFSSYRVQQKSTKRKQSEKTLKLIFQDQTLLKGPGVKVANIREKAQQIAAQHR